VVPWCSDLQPDLHFEGKAEQVFHKFGLQPLVSVLVGGHWAGLNMLGDEPEVNFDLAILGFQGENPFILTIG
jgi:hypothetical protein